MKHNKMGPTTQRKVTGWRQGILHWTRTQVGTPTFQIRLLHLQSTPLAWDLFLSPPSVLTSSKTMLPCEDGSNLLYIHSHPLHTGHSSGPRGDSMASPRPPPELVLCIYLLIYPLHFSHPIIFFCLFLFLPWRLGPFLTNLCISSP